MAIPCIKLISVMRASDSSNSKVEQTPSPSRGEAKRNMCAYVKKLFSHFPCHLIGLEKGLSVIRSPLRFSSHLLFR